MGLILGLFIGFVLWGYWIAVMLTIYFCMMTIAYFGQGKIIKGAVSACFALSLIGWWQALPEKEGFIAPLIPTPEGFHELLSNIAWFGGFAVVCAVLYKYKKYRQAQTSISVFGAQPVIEGNVVPFVHANREEKQRVMTIQEYKCANPYCNADLRGGTPHWDHIVPRSKGGNDSVQNGQWLCDTCNLNKGDKDWLVFMYGYALAMGQDPNINSKPWQKYVTMRATNGLLAS